MAFFPAQPG